MKFKPIEYRAHNAYDTAKASDEATIPASAYGESMTVQSQAEDADINVMLKRFGVLGQMPQSIRVPEYGDFTGVTDFRGALEAVMNAQDEFMKLPPVLRARFENDPQQFLEYAQNPANLDEMVKMGLAVTKAGVDVNGARTGGDAGSPNSSAGAGAGGQSAAASGGAGASAPK